MTLNKAIAFFVAVLIFNFLFPAGRILADFDCLTLTNGSTPDQKQFCKNELDQLNQQLAELNRNLANQKKQTGTINGDITYLTSQINALKTKIKARASAITQLKVDITEKSSKIKTLSSKIEKERESLAQLLRRTSEMDNQTFVDLVLSDENLSGFYRDVDSFASIKKMIKQSVDEIQGIKQTTESEKKDLEKKKDAELDAKTELENAQKKVSQSEADKKKLLAISKQKEDSYLKLTAEKKARADKIRSALFSLAGISTKIEFGTALQYANEANQKTGIDPAFLLAVLTQESNLGSNVGKCYLADSTSGSGVNRDTGKVWPNVMKSSRDLQPFLEIVGKLGLNPLDTAVSCPIASAGGYGGAMGPAQFIASTWVIFEDRLKDLLGHEANPWSPRDAFIASAMYLTDLGAVGTSSSAQNRAACKYYGTGGSSCSYSRSVAKLKSGIQDNIDLLSN